MERPYKWKQEHARLWQELVPSRGQADTLQGELVRIVGKLTDEAYRNGNGNWDEDSERMWRLVARQLDDPDTFSAEECHLIRQKVEEIIRDRDCPDLSADGSPYYLVTEKVIDWCMAHPELIPHRPSPSLRR